MKLRNILNIVALTSAVAATTLLAGCDASSSDTGTKAAASKEAVKIGIPADATNGGRGLLLLEKAGLIEVNDDAGYTPELKDVTSYLYNIEIVPTQANTLVATLDDFGASTINGTYAVPAGLIPAKDGLITEVQEVGSDNPFINVIVARTADKDNPDYQTIVKAYQSRASSSQSTFSKRIPALLYQPLTTIRTTPSTRTS